MMPIKRNQKLDQGKDACRQANEAASSRASNDVDDGPCCSSKVRNKKTTQALRKQRQPKATKAKTTKKTAMAAAAATATVTSSAACNGNETATVELPGTGEVSGPSYFLLLKHTDKENRPLSEVGMVVPKHIDGMIMNVHGSDSKLLMFKMPPEMVARKYLRCVQVEVRTADNKPLRIGETRYIRINELPTVPVAEVEVELATTAASQMGQPQAPGGNNTFADVHELGIGIGIDEQLQHEMNELLEENSIGYALDERVLLQQLAGGLGQPQANQPQRVTTDMAMEIGDGGMELGNGATTDALTYYELTTCSIANDQSAMPNVEQLGSEIISTSDIAPMLSAAAMPSPLPAVDVNTNEYMMLGGAADGERLPLYNTLPDIPQDFSELIEFIESETSNGSAMADMGSWPENVVNDINIDLDFAPNLADILMSYDI